MYLPKLIPQGARGGLLAGTFYVQTVVTGERATAATQGIDQNSRVIDMSDTIHLLDPNEAPLTAITMKLRSVKAINPKVEWLEDDYLPTTDAINFTTGYTATATFLVVDNVGYFRVGDVVKVLDTNENMHVVALGADGIQVTRSIGTAAASTLDDNDVLLIIGNANAENSTKRAMKTTQKTPLYNLCQIFRWEFGASGTLMESQLYGGDDLSYQTKKAGKEFRIQMERSFLFGDRDEDLTGATPLRFCDGILNRITTNVTSLVGNGSLTADILETFLRSGFRYGPARKILFASRPIVSFITILARSSLQTRPTDTTFPLALTEYVSPHGKLYITTHNLLEGTGANNWAYDGWAVLLDMDSIFYRPLGGRDTRLKTNIQANDQDGRIDGFLAECCPMLIQEKNHAILRNVKTV